MEGWLSGAASTMVQVEYCCSESRWGQKFAKGSKVNQGKECLRESALAMVRVLLSNIRMLGVRRDDAPPARSFPRKNPPNQALS